MITFDSREKYFPGMDIPEIRKKLIEYGFTGHENIEVNSTGFFLVLIQDDESVKFALQRRIDADNKIGLFGGAAKPGESLEDCAIRETLEEIGLQTKFAETLHTIKCFDNKDYRKYPTGDEMTFNMTCFLGIAYQSDFDSYFAEDLMDKNETSGIYLSDKLPNDEDLFSNHAKLIKILYEIFMNTYKEDS